MSVKGMRGAVRRPVPSRAEIPVLAGVASGWRECYDFPMVRSVVRPFAVATFWLGLSVSASLAEGAFLTELEDLPLAPGLAETPGGMLFDSPTGRIVEATARGDATAEQVISFYAQTLPELGWQKVGPSSYRRDNEVLKIDVEARKRPLLVRFSLVPQ